ncbi:MAG: amino acid ABC transporter permease [Candidatus Thalassarchaeum sp.]
MSDQIADIFHRSRHMRRWVDSNLLDDPPKSATPASEVAGIILGILVGVIAAWTDVSNIFESGITLWSLIHALPLFLLALLFYWMVTVSAFRRDWRLLLFIVSGWGIIGGMPLELPLGSSLYWLGLITSAYLMTEKNRTNGMVSIVATLVIFWFIRGFFDFVFIEANWDVIWSNRKLGMIGPYFTRTHEESWRLWPALYIAAALGAWGYALLQESRRKFLVPYTVLSLTLLILANYETTYYSNWNDEVLSNRVYAADLGDPIMLKLYGAIALGYVVFLYVHDKFKDAEDYIINAAQRKLMIAAVLGFFSAYFVLDPPGEFGCHSSDYAITCGVSPEEWGGFSLNLILSIAASVLGFGVGIALAFGRRSKLPFFKWPSVAVIELIRSGPLVAWLFIAFILMPDFINPVYEADSVVRTIIILSLFGGCYIAEILRGGLQAVSSGQVEAAHAVGLSPMQTKLFVELPSAIRTTVPALVSSVIGLWKDTSLVYLLGVHDGFNLVRIMPEQRDFLGLHKEVYLIAGIIFFIFAYYLSRISMRVEASLGLRSDTGGEMT